MDVWMITRIEEGARPPTTPTLLRVAEALGGRITVEHDGGRRPTRGPSRVEAGPRPATDRTWHIAKSKHRSIKRSKVQPADATLQLRQQ